MKFNNYALLASAVASAVSANCAIKSGQMAVIQTLTSAWKLYNQQVGFNAKVDEKVANLTAAKAAKDAAITSHHAGIATRVTAATSVSTGAVVAEHSTVLAGLAAKHEEAKVAIEATYTAALAAAQTKHNDRQLAVDNAIAAMNTKATVSAAASVASSVDVSDIASSRRADATNAADAKKADIAAEETANLAHVDTHAAAVRARLASKLSAKISALGSRFSTVHDDIEAEKRDAAATLAVLDSAGAGGVPYAGDCIVDVQFAIDQVKADRNATEIWHKVVIEGISSPTAPPTDAPTAPPTAATFAIGDLPGALGRGISYSADGSRVAVQLGGSGGIRIYSEVGLQFVQVGSDIPDGRECDLSADGSRVVVGYPYYGGSTRSGLVRVYQEVGGQWVQLGQDLVGENTATYSGDTTNYRFGRAVEMSNGGDRIAVLSSAFTPSDYWQERSKQGSIRIFDEIGGQWVEVGLIYGEDLKEIIVISLSGDGSRVASGLTGNNKVRVYADAGGNSWQQVGLAVENLGRSVDQIALNTDGSRFASSDWVGYSGHKWGTVRVYHDVGGQWVQLGSTITGEYESDRSGYSMDLSGDGNRVAVGTPMFGPSSSPQDMDYTGMLRIFDFVAGDWALTETLNGEEPAANMGYQVSLGGNSGGRVAVARDTWSPVAEVTVFQLP